MMEQEALEIVRDRVRQKRLGADAELEAAISILEKAILPLTIQAPAPAGALTAANEDDRIFLAATGAADSIRDEDVRERLKWVGFPDLAANSSDEDISDAAVSSILEFLRPLTEKDSQEYYDFVGEAARILVERAGQDWDKALKRKIAEMRNARRPG